MVRFPPFSPPPFRCRSFPRSFSGMKVTPFYIYEYIIFISCILAESHRC
jgi:hypothetical protein